jgi:F-type H+-transporting ATPase subunit b
MKIHLDAEVFVAVGFTLFLFVLLWAGAHKKLAGAIDARIDRIKAELAEAERLRAEAEALLASFEQKRAEAEAEAAAIVERAKAEADALAKDARQRLDDFVARGAKQVEQKIAQAEAQASAEVRAAAADAAVKIAESVLSKGRIGTVDFVSAGIAQVKSLAH